MNSKRQKSVYKATIIFFVAVFAAMMWPIHPWFSRIYPMVLGLPFSLFYLIVLIVLTFLVLLGLYLWEGGESDTRRS